MPFDKAARTEAEIRHAEERRIASNELWEQFQRDFFQKLQSAELQQHLDASLREATEERGPETAYPSTFLTQDAQLEAEFLQTKQPFVPTRPKGTSSSKANDPATRRVKAIIAGLVNPHAVNEHNPIEVALEQRLEKLREKPELMQEVITSALEYGKSKVNKYGRMPAIQAHRKMLKEAFSEEHREQYLEERRRVRADRTAEVTERKRLMDKIALEKQHKANKESFADRAVKSQKIKAFLVSLHAARFWLKSKAFLDERKKDIAHHLTLQTAARHIQKAWTLKVMARRGRQFRASMVIIRRFVSKRHLHIREKRVHRSSDLIAKFLEDHLNDKNISVIVLNYMASVRHTQRYIRSFNAVTAARVKRLAHYWDYAHERLIEERQDLIRMDSDRSDSHSMHSGVSDQSASPRDASPRSNRSGATALRQAGHLVLNVGRLKSNQSPSESNPSPRNKGGSARPWGSNSKAFSKKDSRKAPTMEDARLEEQLRTALKPIDPFVKKEVLRIGLKSLRRRYKIALSEEDSQLENIDAKKRNALLTVEDCKLLLEGSHEDALEVTKKIAPEVVRVKLFKHRDRHKLPPWEKRFRIHDLLTVRECQDWIRDAERATEAVKGMAPEEIKLWMRNAEKEARKLLLQRCDITERIPLVIVETTIADDGDSSMESGGSTLKM